MGDHSVNSSSSGSVSDEESVHSASLGKWEFGNEDIRPHLGDTHSESSDKDRDDESESYHSKDSGSLHSDNSESLHSRGTHESDSEQRSYHSHETFEDDSGQTCDEDEMKQDEKSEDSNSHGSENEFEESQGLMRVDSEDTESQGMRSDDETDTCMLSIDEHVRRRKAKAIIRMGQTQLQNVQEIKNVQSEESGESHDMRSDDETDTCMLSIDEHVRRRHAKWMRLRNGTEAAGDVDLTCLNSIAGTLEETTVVSIEEEGCEEEEEDEEGDDDDEESVESDTLESRTAESAAMESLTLGSVTFGTIESRTIENLPPVQERQFDTKHAEDWRISNWRNDARPIEDTKAVKEDRALKGVDYMSAFDIASTNRDISVVEPGISKKAAREAFEKKEVPDEIPVMLRDDVSSIYPPIRAKARPYPPKRQRQPYNGRILEDVVSYDEELGDASTKEYEMSIVGSEEKGKKIQVENQRSDIELILIGMISLSLLILVILLIVILAKNS
eukprot:scaffold1147_cov172-Amphora_coffeaeformis.AAC.6